MERRAVEAVETGHVSSICYIGTGVKGDKHYEARDPFYFLSISGMKPRSSLRMRAAKSVTKLYPLQEVVTNPVSYGLTMDPTMTDSLTIIQRKAQSMLFGMQTRKIQLLSIHSHETF